MTVLAVCRDINVGTDVGGYEMDFYRIKTISNSLNYIRHHFEYGYLTAIVLFKQFSNDYLLFISLTFIPLWIGFLKYIKDSGVNWALALFVFYTLGYYFVSLNIMRQMMAIGMILAFLPWLYARKYKWFAIAVILISYLFHKSEMMMLFLIPVHYYTSKQIRIVKRPLYIALAVSFAAFYINTTFFRDVFMFLATLLPDAEHYESYVIGSDENLSNVTSLFYTLFAIFVVYVKNPNNHLFETYTYIMSIVVFNIFNAFGGYGSRVFYDFSVFAVVLLPTMFFDKHTRFYRIFRVATIVFCLGYFMYNYSLNNAGEINPYQFR